MYAVIYPHTQSSYLYNDGKIILWMDEYGKNRSLSYWKDSPGDVDDDGREYFLPFSAMRGVLGEDD